MRIAFIGQKGLPAKSGGIERHVEELSVRLVKNGHQVFAYARPWYTRIDRLNFQGVKIINLPSLRTKHLDAISHTFLATMHALFSDFDVIHYHGVGPSLLSFIPRLFKPRVKVVATFHCIDRKHQKWGVFARSILYLGELAACRFPHKTIAVSQILKFYCSQIYNRDSEYIPNGVTKKKTSVADNLIVERFGLKNGEYLLAVSRLVRHKGLHYLIAAYLGLKTDKKLVIVGDSAFTDDYVAELKALAGEDPRIIFAGYQTGEMLDQLFANAYLFVHPSESEGLPIVVLEAMNHGRTVLSSDIAENLEVVKGYGFTFKNKDVADLTARLNFLLGQPELLQNAGAASKIHVLTNYNWEDITSQTMAVYQDLLGYHQLAEKLKTKTLKA